jgi:hypothetical protein
MAETPTPVPDTIRRTEGPDKGSFFERLQQGPVTVERYELTGVMKNAAYDSERLELQSFRGPEPFHEAGLDLHRFAWVNRDRLVVRFERVPTTLAGERFRVSQVRELDGTPGALIKKLNAERQASSFWIKAEPWPFPVPGLKPPEPIDVMAVIETLGCDVVLLRDQQAAVHRQATELLIMPIFPESQGYPLD